MHRLLVLMLGLAMVLGVCTGVLASEAGAQALKEQQLYELLQGTSGAINSFMTDLRTKQDRDLTDVQTLVSQMLSQLDEAKKKLDGDWTLYQFRGIIAALRMEVQAVLAYTTEGDSLHLDLADMANLLVDSAFRQYGLEMRLRDNEFVDGQDSDSYLTDRINKTSFSMFLIRSSGEAGSLVEVWVNTRTQPIWNYYVGNGRFSVADREVRSAYLEAGQAVYRLLDSYGIAKLNPESTTVYFTIQGATVGTWNDGTFTLDGE